MASETKQPFVAMPAAPLQVPAVMTTPMPTRVTCAPVSAPDFEAMRDGWLRHEANQNLGPTDPTTCRATYTTRFDARALLSERGELFEHKAGEGELDALAGEVTTPITRAGTLHGFALFYEGDAGRTHDAIFLPIAVPFDVRPGDRVTLNFCQPAAESGDGYLARWSGGVDWDRIRTFHMQR